MANPLGLSLSKPFTRRNQPFDRLRANGKRVPFGLSLSKPSSRIAHDKLK